MRSKAVASFWDGYRRLPTAIQARARKQYGLWAAYPHHPSLRFKKVGDYWSARVTGAYRAVGIRDGDTIVWFFIGTHAEYDRLLS
jgi:hypothetical protein